MIINLLIALGLLAVLFVIIVSLRPADFRIARSITISAPPERAFEQVNDLHKWQVMSPYARGCESITDAYGLLDRTPYGRQEDFEDSPAGWPQKPTYG